MTIYRQEPAKPIRFWGDANGHKFELLATYVPNEDNDPWVEYQNTLTGQAYTCRQEAFESRFQPLPD